MFSTMQNFSTRRPSAFAYREVGASTAVEGATPHKMVSLLFAELLSQIANARGALARQDVPEKCRAIGHAVRIVEEGLTAALDMQSGGAIASNLKDLYDYIVQQLTLANLKNDDAKLDECATLVKTLREGWDGIGDQVHAAPRAST
jgi:flagellar protein FliS